MLGIVLLYFIGKYYYKLAEEFEKHRWGFAILGVATYYVGTMIGGAVFGVLDGILGWGIDWENTWILSLIALPFGLLFTTGLYYILKKQWEKEVPVVKDEIEDIGNSTEDNN